MANRDRRRRVLESALFSPTLTPAEKNYMVTVVVIRAEYVNGDRRHGSKAMGPDGQFTLHRDYLAKALNTSPEGVRKLRRSLVRKQALTLVHTGTFGRPSTWQAHPIRGAKNGRVTGGEIGTPYGLGEWLTRVAEKAPLTYKTPDRRNHERTPRDPRHLPIQAQQQQGQDRGTPGPIPANACQWHPHQCCPDDCANAPVTRREDA